MSDIINIGILGAGSIGSLFGFCLADIKSEKYSIEMTFICRSDKAEAINKNGLTIHLEERLNQVDSITAVSSLEEIRERSFYFLFLTTKAYDSAKTLTEYHSIIQQSKYLIILQNGIGNEDIISEYCNSNKIMRCVTTEGAFLKNPGHLIHTGSGFTKIGFPFLQLPEDSNEKARNSINLLHELLTLAGFNSYISENIIGDCWEKIFVNIGINPFGALTRLRNGELIKNESLKELMAEAVREAIRVAEKKGIKLPDRDYVDIMFDVAVKTAENQNSMLQDVLKEKKTEIEYINGKIVSYAAELSLSVPINELLTALVKGLESSYLINSQV